MKWEEKYQMQVETLDMQHKKLFGVARQIYTLFKDGSVEKQKFACQEGVKFLKSHLVKHYEDEEAYMQETGYEHYEAHKQLHDNMLHNILPVVERELEETDYADKSIQKFIGMCIGWLINHISIEDMAIVGRNFSRLGRRVASHDLSSFIETIYDMVTTTFGADLQPEVINEHYAGEYFGKVVCHEIKYDYILEKRKVYVRVALEETMLFSVCEQLLGSEVTAVDETVLGVVEMISRQFMERLAEVFNCGADKYAYKDNTFLRAEHFFELITQKAQTVSILFGTGLGMFALAIDDSGKPL